MNVFICETDITVTVRPIGASLAVTATTDHHHCQMAMLSTWSI